MFCLEVFILAKHANAQNNSAKIDAFYYKAIEKINVKELEDAKALLNYTLLLDDSIASANYAMSLITLFE